MNVETEETDMEMKTDKELVQLIQYGATREQKNEALTELTKREANRAYWCKVARA